MESMGPGNSCFLLLCLRFVWVATPPGSKCSASSPHKRRDAGFEADRLQK